MAQAHNPYLPGDEYVPDVEPHLFGDRVYLYGSHDRFNGHGFCLEDYVCYSAPKGDLKEWRYEGFIYHKSDDPHYKGHGAMYAPDVCQGPDGRYYLYYAFAPGFLRRSWAIRCAVASSPVGPFHYHGEVGLFPFSQDYLPFDPAVYVEGNGVYLYYGSAMFFPVLGVSKKRIKGGAVIKLDPRDMLTPLGAPVTTVLSSDEKLGKHAFFEASSMRKIDGRYYFVYSSLLGHELCYATSESPMGPFEYGGTIVSNGDIGLGEHDSPKHASNYTGNTHGGILSVDDKHYIFYHRQTNRHCFSRQGCAERIFIGEDGTIAQVEMTSSGLNDGLLLGKGEYEARIACNLMSKKGCRFYGGITKKPAGCHPYFTEDESGRQIIANFSDGCVVGFKYFALRHLKRVIFSIKGKADGVMELRLSPNGKPVAESRLIIKGGTAMVEMKVDDLSGIYPLFFAYKGKGRFEFHSFALE